MQNPNAKMNQILSHTTMNALCCTTTSLRFCRRAVIQPRRSHLLHDLVTQIFSRSLQYGIVVMGIIDSFDYVHNHHRQN